MHSDLTKLSTEIIKVLLKCNKQIIEEIDTKVARTCKQHSEKDLKKMKAIVNKQINIYQEEILLRLSKKENDKRVIKDSLNLYEFMEKRKKRKKDAKEII